MRQIAIVANGPKWGFQPRNEHLDALAERTLAAKQCREWRKIKTVAWREANRERWRLFEKA